MRAAQIHELGEAPQPADVAEPEAGEGQALVEVRAVALNPIDVAIGSGRFYGGHPPLPYVPGSEAAGVVDGRRVYASGGGLGIARDGTLAERAAAPAAELIDLPDGVDDGTAVAAGIAGLAGWMPVSVRAPVREDDRVLVLGATGAVGIVALQAAKARGAARVVAAGRNEHALTQARELGADETVHVDGGDDLAERFKAACGGDGPTWILDPLWGEVVVAATEAASRRARIVNLGQSAGPVAPLTSAVVRSKELEILGYSNFALSPEQKRAGYLALLAQIEAGRIRIPLETFSLDEVGDAWRRQSESGHAKVIVRVP